MTRTVEVKAGELADAALDWAVGKTDRPLSYLGVGDTSRSDSLSESQFNCRGVAHETAFSLLPF